MNLSHCKHIRILNGDEYEMNLESLIKSIEFQFKTDFTLIPNWKQLLESIDNEKQKYERKIKRAALRKLFIINKIHEQQFRPSPFTLTDGLVRTACLWKEIEANCKKGKEVSSTEISSFCDETDEHMDEISNVNLTAHPNSEIFESEDFVEPVIQTITVEDENKSVNNLPVIICTNPHKIISPFGSQCSSISNKIKEGHEDDLLEESQDINLILKSQTKCITCKPYKIVIDNVLKKQVINFYLTNTCTEALNIRFIIISDTSPFKKATVHPKTPLKLYPGLTAAYKFIFTLASSNNMNNIFLHFRIGRNVLLGLPHEVFSVPVCEKSLERKIQVTESINMKPVYSWQINFKSYFPKGIVEISISDEHSYFIYIRKREVDFSKESDDQEMSLDVIGLNTDSEMQRLEDDDLEVQSELLSHTKNEEMLGTVDSISNIGLVSMVVDDIVNLALDTFVFEKTFLYLSPYSKSRVSVLFSKAEHEGYHQCYYDLECYDANTETLVITKTVKIFAEVLTHPVQIHPNILDMTDSPVNFGFREDRLVIKNTHKLYPVTLKIELTKKMRRLLQIIPTEMSIPNSASGSVIVRLCSKYNGNEDTNGDLVHLTIKIILTGHESIYRKVPFMFYEIIAPCVTEFNKVYRNS